MGKGRSLRLEGGCKRYGPDVLFEELDLELQPGLALRVLGPNGSGKTQLLLALCGLTRLDRGRVVTGEGAELAVLPEDPHLRDRYLRYVPATPAALSSLTVAELALTLARGLDPLSFRSRQQAIAHNFTTIQRRLEIFVGRSLDPRTPASSLSLGQQKRLVMAATAAAGELPRALLVDEPLAGLDSGGIAAVLDALAELRRQGVAVVVAEHRAEIEALGFDGELVMPYRRSSTAPRVAIVRAVAPASPLGAVVCRPAPYFVVRDARAGYPGTALRCAEFMLGPGELAVIAGSNGTGKTGFLKALVGILPARLEGYLEFGGRALPGLAGPLTAGEVRYMSQDRRSFLDLRAGDALRAAGLAGNAEVPAEIQQVANLVGPRKWVSHLSSGNRALLSLAQTLATRPRLALLDEPTANVDSANRQRITELIEHARRAWKTAFLVVEHGELPALRGMRYHIERDAENTAWLQPTYVAQGAGA